MAESMASSPPPPVPRPPDPSEETIEEDFLPSARGSVGDAPNRSGDSPPPPERKLFDNHATNKNNVGKSNGGGGGGGSCPPPSDRMQLPPSDVAAGASGGAPLPGSKRRDRYGMGGSSNNGPTKFQFYVPASRSLQEGGGPMEGANGSGRAGEGSAPEREQGSGPKNARNKPVAGGGAKNTKKGIDPPEKEPPTAPLTAEESARKARSRLIQLQHRESHASGPSRGEPPSSSEGPPHVKPPPGGREKDGSHSDSSSSRCGGAGGRRSRAGTGSSFGGLESIGAAKDDDDDDDDYTHMNMDPIESDEEDPVSDHFDDKRPPNAAGIKAGKPPHHSPLRPSADQPQQQFVKKHPSSVPQRPSHRLPPQQLMQELHAGRGSFGRQGGGGPPGAAGRKPFPPALGNHPGPPQQSPHPTQKQPVPYPGPQQPQPPSPNSRPSRHTLFGQQQQYHQQHHQQLQQQHQQQNHRGNYSQPVRRKSDLYSDGIHLLEKAASEAREREELDTLNDGINYLRTLETALEKGEVGRSRSMVVGNSGMTGAVAPDRNSSGSIAAGVPGMGVIQMTPTGGEPSRRAGGVLPASHFPPPPPLTNRPNRPPPKGGKIGGQQQGQVARQRSDSVGDEMDKLAAQTSSAQLQQQPHGVQQHEGQPLGGPAAGPRIHRPPPPRQPPSVPTTTAQVRKRPVITAELAMDYVMSASARSPFPYEGDVDGSGDPRADNESDRVAADINKMHTFLNAMIREDGEEADMDGNNGNGGSRPPLGKKAGSFDSVEEGSVDSSTSSGGGVPASDSQEFERNTSLSMHAEEKFSSGPYAPGGSRYAEDKHGMSDGMLLSRMEGLQVDDSGVLLRKRSHNERQRSVDPPVDDDEDGPGAEVENGRLASGDNIVSPSVLPMRTMNERLYAVEAVIPTPTGYRHHQQELFAGEMDVFENAMPRLGTHDEGDRGDVVPVAPTVPSHALGPRSNRPGGTTGVVLDMGPGTDCERDYSSQRSSPLEKERSQTEHSSESSSAVSPSSSENEDGHDPQDSLAGDHPPDGESHGELCKYSWGSDSRSEPEAADLGSSVSNQHPAMSLMMNLCSHLLPAMDHNNSLAFLQNKQRSHLAWDDEDPDELGYVVHQLTNSQLVCLENAFEKVVSLLGRQSSKDLNGSNKNFERDLEEAELILDREEKQYESDEVKKVSTLSREEGSHGNADEVTQSKERKVERECVPDFPGIFSPGQGKPGEMECFYLPIITKSQKTGFEPTKDLVLKSGSVFANNYLVQNELGSAAFSTAYRCLDLSSEEDEDGYQDEVCLKVIKNTKDYFDQSLDEIKILQLLKDTGQVQENNIVEMKSFFYHREHLVIVTELLRQNLYEFGKSILESRGPLYFTRLRLSYITRQCLIALKFVHELGLMHCDIKPENILLSSYSRALVKVIDFGSSSFITDRQSSYIQSRSYRAPEVILGLPYGGKIDMWSLGCVVAEMYTNEVTFQNDSELSMLSRIEAICGPFPRHMIAKGRNSHRIFTDSGLIYEKISSEVPEGETSHDSSDDDDDSEKMLFNVYQPKTTTIAARLGFDEDLMDQPRLSKDVSKILALVALYVYYHISTDIRWLLIFLHRVG